MNKRLLAGLLALAPLAWADPKTICYSAQPNRYLVEHAAEVAKIYDGFFISTGSWDKGVSQEWIAGARPSLAALNKAGVTENFLTVHFDTNGEWPSEASILSEEFAAKMEREFGALGRVAKDLGFRGVTIDIEYPYPRYDLTHAVYSYKNYTAEDLMAHARRQGERTIAGVLNAFPEATVLVLPGELRSRPLARAYMVGMLETMAQRDAPGGLHMGSEYSYSLHDPVTTLAVTRFDDPAPPLLASKRVAAYWKKRCTIAPGVWPLHMVETEGPGYPVQPWPQEIAELREQMRILRTAAKRYVWSYSGAPVWYVHTPELEREYGLRKPKFARDDVRVEEWHRLLAEKGKLDAKSALAPLVAAIGRYDEGRLNAEQLCDAFGTPGRWWILGMLSNPFISPQFASPAAAMSEIDTQTAYAGRDGAVRWFGFDNLDPRGILSGRYVYDYRGTDAASAHLVTYLHSPKRREAQLQVGWDDGILVRFNDQVVFDRLKYPGRGKGLLYRDKQLYEAKTPVVIEAGRTRVTVTSVNSHGAWAFALRVTDERGVPFPDLRFRLE